MSEERLEDELASFEASLKALQPAPSAVQRDRVMFLAGQASAARAVTGRGSLHASLRFWQAAAAASFFAAVVSGTLWVHGGRPGTVEQVVRVPTAASEIAVSNGPAAKAFAKWQPAPSFSSRSKMLPAQQKEFDRRMPGSS